MLKDKLFTLTTKVNRALKESKEKQQKNKTAHERIQSESRLARAQQIAHMGSWELDFTTNVILLSDEGCRIYGLQPGQNRQSFETWLSFIHPEDLNFVLEKIKESQDFLRNFSIYHRIVHKDGLIRYIYSESKLEFDLNGKPAGLYGIAQDVTEQKKEKEKLKQSEKRFRSLIEKGMDLIALRSPEGKMFYITSYYRE